MERGALAQKRLRTTGVDVPSDKLTLVAEEGSGFITVIGAPFSIYRSHSTCLLRVLFIFIPGSERETAPI